MKAKAEHVVPLPDEAFEVLNAAMEAHGDEGLIFPARRRKVLHDKVLIQILQDHGIDATVHGFRSSFRDWAAETGVERDVAEAALAHTVRNAVEAAYLRTDYLEKRRAVMEAWAKHYEPTKGQLAIANKRRGNAKPPSRLPVSNGEGALAPLFFAPSPQTACKTPCAALFPAGHPHAPRRRRATRPQTPKFGRIASKRRGARLRRFSCKPCKSHRAGHEKLPYGLWVRPLGRAA